MDIEKETNHVLYLLSSDNASFDDVSKAIVLSRQILLFSKESELCLSPREGDSENVDVETFLNKYLPSPSKAKAKNEGMMESIIRNHFSDKTNCEVNIYCGFYSSFSDAKTGISVVCCVGEQIILKVDGKYEPIGNFSAVQLSSLAVGLFVASSLFELSNKISIYSKSENSVKTLKYWASVWEKNSWRKKNGNIQNLKTVKSAYARYKLIKKNISLFFVPKDAETEGNSLFDYPVVSQKLNEASAFAEEHIAEKDTDLTIQFNYKTRNNKI